ncbi:hypothetical protein [Pseudomonas umsongensis]|uniref:hypothetical protein n=1 Tax=Pseudomonas umsongensis TaxID=198618 RepID=UPI00351D1EFF
MPARTKLACAVSCAQADHCGNRSGRLTTDQIPLPQHSCRQNSISATRFVNVSPATTCSRDVSQKVKNCDTLVDVIFEQPYCRISNVVDKKVAQRQAASRHLKDLVSI